MSQSTAADLPPVAAGDLRDSLRAVRARTEALAAPLSPEDACVQSMPDASPAKWHLAHTSWFFEHFLLAPRLPRYRVFHERFEYLFNSYYFTVGQMHQRPRRGLVTRPSLAEVLDYRAYVGAALDELLDRERGDPNLAFLVTLGMHHEQQHQELLLTDIKHLLAQNPLQPAYVPLAEPTFGEAPPLYWLPGRPGVVETGHAGEGFAFDNETPRHPALLGEHSLASRLVTNGEFREFIAAGGYREPALWLSDGWATVVAEGWDRPLYWEADGERAFTLGGVLPLDPAAPVTHLSYYEADAFARWAGARLPTEFEWEAAASQLAEAPATDRPGTELGPLEPLAAAPGPGLLQLFGAAWQWTASPYAPYPGFRPLAGSLGEYNGKFMCSQLVLRGSSCATPPGHARTSYRNFFYPAQRWQFSGLRLARDGA